ncbi:MAG: hypothetical protein KGM17_01835 [Sphingomonadales bacterium]|nr:hypothetical protein [Sphingomonadales bacterium]
MHRALLLPFLLAACDRVSPEEQARRDARDIAMVEGAQRSLPPPVPLNPQALDPGALAQSRCTFADPAFATGRPILGTAANGAAMRFGGQTQVFAADAGSSRLPGQTWSRYTGKRYALRLEPQPTLATPTPSGFSDQPRQPAALTVTDDHERQVFEAVGDLTCS